MSGRTQLPTSSNDTQTARAVREDVDLDRTVWFSGGEAYHRATEWGPACPDQIGRTEEKTLAEAAENGLRPCKQCQPVDYRPLATDGGWPSGDPCPECGELMDVGVVGNPGETITWQECEDCGIGWGPFTGFVDTDQEDEVATDGGQDVHDVPGHGRLGGVDDPVPRAEYGERERPEPATGLASVRELVEEARDAAADLDDVHRARLDLVLAGLGDVDGPGGLLDEIAYHLETLTRRVDDVDVTHPVRNALQVVDAVRAGDLR